VVFDLVPWSDNMDVHEDAGGGDEDAASDEDTALFN
jgi:hypothetical protein